MRNLSATASFEPLRPSEIDALERRIGVAVPAMVREVYGTVGNGGFGPGNGLIGLVGGFLSDLGLDVERDYVLRREDDPGDPGWFWPEGVLPICHWGCGIYSCVDCTEPGPPIVRFNPNRVDEDWNDAWASEATSIEQWLRDWLCGDVLLVLRPPDAN